MSSSVQYDASQQNPAPEPPPPGTLPLPQACREGHPTLDLECEECDDFVPCPNCYHILDNDCQCNWCDYVL